MSLGRPPASLRIARPWIAATFAFGTSLGHADGLPPDTGFYVGGAVGVSRDTGSYSFADANVTAQGLTNAGFKTYVGFRAMRFVGLEVGYAKLGATAFEGVDANGQAFSDRYTHDAVTFSLVGFVPLGERWELIGRFGVVANSTYNTEQSCIRRTRWGAVVQQNCPSTPLAWGFGVRYRLNEKLGIRLDYDNYALQDAARSPRAELNFLSVGLDYRF